MKYFTAWQPTYLPGTYRTYANPSIGMLGLITAKSMNEDFTLLMEQQLLPALGMKSTYIDVPPDKMIDYAQGYSQQGTPVRMTQGVLSDEAYGMKTTAHDMIHFIRANINLAELDAPLQTAVIQTHTGYFKLGQMTQDLVWEQYSYPTSLKALLTGNSPAVAYKHLPVTEIKPPQPPRTDVLINKTGSTNGFGAYIAFVPEKQIGIVLLANKNYPNSERVTIAHQIITALDHERKSAQ
jgi:beta-lactamase class C